jgi:hypothetical protein
LGIRNKEMGMKESRCTWNMSEISITGAAELPPHLFIAIVQDNLVLFFYYTMKSLNLERASF